MSPKNRNMQATASEADEEAVFLTRRQMPLNKIPKAAAKAQKNDKNSTSSSKLNVLNLPRDTTPLFLYREFLREQGPGSTILDIEIARGFPSGSRTATTYVFMSSLSAAQSAEKKLKGLSGRIKGNPEISNARVSLKVEVLSDVSEAAGEYLYRNLSDGLEDTVEAGVR
ncbi:hypothetical protein P171DRAFT_222295 [Karstenula rhodostoma CBS 690.94]|uniref:RRM domain-containing protein n=1 Tax=Karstenula rhodostoma CBS 690.94 TaxID=1392251 RepID=A0A9P4PRS0_9PLEO|nr:hypothetical protein P171DRAFT_222295 [Karstenula rhodostoma CBS 690.94]